MHQFITKASMHEMQGFQKGPQRPLRQAQKNHKNFKDNKLEAELLHAIQNKGFWTNTKISNNMAIFWPKLMKRKGVKSEGRGRPFLLFQGVLPTQII